MSDRASAEIFGRIFELLAKQRKEAAPTCCKEAQPYDDLAKGIARISISYDFEPRQIEKDDALIELGLAVGIAPFDEVEYDDAFYSDAPEGDRT